jgi:transposase
MEVLYQHCAGLDVHKKSIAACVLHSPADGGTRRQTRTFGTMLEDLEKLRDWLMEEGCDAPGWRQQASIGSRSTTCWRAT